MMKKNFVLVLFLCMGIASLNVSAQRSGTSETVLLRVSFEPEMSDTTACAVCGDGLGDYIDGYGDERQRLATPLNSPLFDG